jgi:hypothetical protein
MPGIWILTLGLLQMLGSFHTAGDPGGKSNKFGFFNNLFAYCLSGNGIYPSVISLSQAWNRFWL